MIILDRLELDPRQETPWRVADLEASITSAIADFSCQYPRARSPRKGRDL